MYVRTYKLTYKYFPLKNIINEVRKKRKHCISIANIHKMSLSFYDVIKTYYNNQTKIKKYK